MLYYHDLSNSNRSHSERFSEALCLSALNKTSVSHEMSLLETEDTLSSLTSTISPLCSSQHSSPGTFLLMPVLALIVLPAVELGLWLHNALAAPGWLATLAGFAGLGAVSWLLSKRSFAAPLLLAATLGCAYVVLVNFGSTWALASLALFSLGSWKHYRDLPA